MTRQHIFVTYSPSPRNGGDARTGRPRRIGEPAAVLASALLAGGVAQALGDAPSLSRASNHPVSPTRAAAPKPLPYLALVTVEVAPVAATASLKPAVVEPVAAPRPRTASAAPAAKVSGQRRDLAGFLEDRGLTPTGEVSAGMIETPGTGETAPQAAIVLLSADLGLVATAAVPVIAAATLQGSASGEHKVQAQAAPEVQSFPTVTVDGEALGAVTMRGGKVHLASLVGLLRLKLPASEFERLASAPAADSFVDVEMLRAAGITAELDPAGETLTLAAG